ncbi:sensor histidine kinase [Hymenobacter sp. B81]|uniref:sensor histidine kinase n=1 Tax=Hymenobacter sp. B81 TaxID=3344878 RepID=UPI0037DC7404
MADSLVNRLLRDAELPLTRRQFWLYATLFWGLMVLISGSNPFGLTLLTGRRPMFAAELLQWWLTFVLWWAFTPGIFYATLRFPLPLAQGPRAWLRTLLGHLLVASAFGLLVCAVCFVVVRPLYAHETGKWIGPGYIVAWFLSSYSTTALTYLLVVVGGSIARSAQQNQRLQRRAAEYELHSEQLRTQLATARLQALQMQLNPHFLFNTHHTIVALMMQHETDRAIDMVTGLSDLLRGVLAHQQAEFIPLGEELALTRQYLAIQQVRFQDRLRIEYCVEPAAEACPVPPLLLQPLVENALTHGLAERAAGGCLRIAVAAAGPGAWTVVVEDNGPGKPVRGGSGLGLRNTRARLTHAYGAAAWLELAQQPGWGTTVTLTLPRQPAPASTAALPHV